MIESPNLVFLESLNTLTLDWDDLQCRPQPPPQGWTALSLIEPSSTVQSLSNCTIIRSHLIDEPSTTVPLEAQRLLPLHHPCNQSHIIVSQQPQQ